MIEVMKAKNGCLVLFKNGKYLASSFDPQKEAATWWTHCQRLVKHAETLFVLGLGSGYHIEEIRQQLPNIKVVVIECDSEVVTAYRENFNSLDAEILLEPDWRKIYSHPSVAEGVRTQYAVLMHPPSYLSEADYFANAHKFLLARSVEGLFALLKYRPEFLNEFDQTKLADLARSGEPVTIKTISRIMKPTAFANENRRLWKVLEELVA